jgi:hypothetical protein
MKETKDNYLFKEDNMEIKNNYPILHHTAILDRYLAPPFCSCAVVWYRFNSQSFISFVL